MLARQQGLLVNIKYWALRSLVVEASTAGTESGLYKSTGRLHAYISLEQSGCQLT